jgi:hypothetical protein
MNQSYSRPPEITLVQGTSREQQTKAQLLRLFAQYPLDKWRYTERVQIQEGVIPHSHPVLTLHTRHVNEDAQLLGTYIHEQLHWFCGLVEKSDAAMRATDEFGKRYPDLPLLPPEGCGSAFSNALHVLINALEYQGLGELLGAEEARACLERKTYYTKVYELVLKEYEQISAVIGRYGLFPPVSPPEEKSFVKIDELAP